MSREADYTIQGFIYQFNTTLLNLLNSSDDSEITVEGVIEDIDVLTPHGVKAIQCKYHEAKSKFTLSSIYKPVLQMLCSYMKNSGASIEYILHAHFPSEVVNTTKTLVQNDISEILSSKSKGLEKYIKELDGFTDVDGFLKRFTLLFGPTLEDTEKAIIVALSKEGFSTSDAKDIFYPNAIQAIADLSIRHDVAKRVIKKTHLLTQLTQTKKTAISRWTKELKSYGELLKKRREQLRTNLNANLRNRCLFLDADYIMDFDSKVVQLIEDFVNKYNSKMRLSHCPIFCIKSSEETINNIWQRLNDKKIGVERGHIGGKFNVQHFLRAPMKIIKEGRSEFQVKICHYDEHEDFLSDIDLDDIFIISKNDIVYLETLEDINIEIIETPEIREIRYLLSLNDSI